METGTGQLTLSPNSTIAVSGVANITGSLSVGSGTCTIQGTGYLLLDAEVSGSAKIVKTGSVSLRLSGANSFTGTLTANGTGYVYAGHPQAFGSTNAGTIMNDFAYVSLSSDINITNEPLTLNNSHLPTIFVYGNSTNTWSSTNFTLLATATITVQTNCALELIGPITGPGGVTKDGGPGRLRFSGSTANTYTGDTIVNEGLLELNKSGTGINAIRAGSLTIGDDVGGASADVVRYTGSSTSQINTAVPITLSSSGLLDLNGHSDDVGRIAFNGGRITTGTGMLTLTDNVKANAAATTAFIFGQLSLSATRTFDVDEGTGSPDLEILAAISGSGGLIKTGPGLLYLAAANSYAGSTTVNEGRVYAAHANAFGSTAAGTTITGRGAIQLLGVDVGAESLTLDRPGSTGVALTASGNSGWAGDITLTTNVSISTGGTLEFSGSLVGPGGLTMVGAGTYTFSGTSANTFAGDTVVNAGTLLLDKQVTDGAIPGPGRLIIGDGVGGYNADVVRLLRDFQIDSSVDITINASACLDLNDNSDTVGGLNLTSGGVFTGTGLLTLSGNVFATMNTNRLAFISGRLGLGTATRTFEVTREPYNTVMAIDATISGTGGLRKTGNAGLLLVASNTYSGLTIVAEGFLHLGDDNALGSTAAGTVVETGARMEMYSVHIGNEALTLNGNGYGVAGTILAWGTNSWAGPITLATDTTFYLYDASYLLDLQGPIGGAGGFKKTGSGTLILSGTDHNTYAGRTTVNAGIVALSKMPNRNAIPADLVIGDGEGGTGADIVRSLANYQLPSTIAITINSSGLLDLNGHIDTIGSNLTLNGGGDVRTGSGMLTLSPNSTVLVNSTNLESTISGRLNVGTGTCTFNIADGVLHVPASVSGSASIIKTGNGYMHLQASNSFTGTLTIDQFWLAISDDWALGSASGGTVLNNNAILGIEGSVVVQDEPLTLNSVTTGGALWVDSGSNTWAGPVSLAHDASIRVFSNLCLNISGPITNEGGLTKLGPGTLLFSGTQNNTYRGPTVIQEGMLGLAKTGATAILASSDLTIGDGHGSTGADIVRYLAGGNQLDVSVPVRINSTGLLDLNDQSDVVGAITFDGGRLTTGTGLATLGGDVTVLSSSAAFGRIAPSSAARNFNVTNGTTLGVTAAVVGAGGLCKSGGGEMLLWSSNSYGGLTVVQEGWLGVAHSCALGGTNGTVVSNGASLFLGYGVTITNESLTLNGPGMRGWGALESGYSGDVNTWLGPIVLNADSTIDPLANNLLVIQGPISGVGGLTKIGEGTLEFEGTSANTYGGTTRVNEGTLVLAQSIHDSAIPGDLIIGNGSGGTDADIVRVAAPHPQIGNAGTVVINNSGLLDLSSFSGPLLPSNVHESIGSLAGSGHVELGSKRLGIGENGTSTAFLGTITGAGGGLAKLGSGRLVFNGVNPYSGVTEVAAGRLVVNGVQPASAVVIRSGAALEGTGTVGQITSTGGTLSPGFSPGTLNSSTVILDASSTFVVELNGSGYDQLNAIGNVVLGNATLQLLSSDLIPGEGQAFVIVNNDGGDAIAGSFAGLGEGALVSVGPLQFHITYLGGTGNDVALIATNTAALHPLLTIWPTSTNTMLVSWPLPDTGWELRTTTNLASTPIVWTLVPPPYSTNATSLYYVDPEYADAKFYQLFKP